MLPLQAGTPDRCVPGHAVSSTPLDADVPAGPAVQAALADVEDDGEWCDKLLRPACASCSPLEPSVCRSCASPYTMLGQRCGALANPLQPVLQPFPFYVCGFHNVSLHSVV